MSKSKLIRTALLASPIVRSSSITPARLYPTSLVRQYASSPSIMQGSFWRDMVPKPLRRSSPSTALKKNIKKKEWNPATFYIVIFLFIGSMSIQMIALRNEHAAFTRRADAKIGLLKEIIERVKNGEEVDVEGLLGTGDGLREQEWEEVLQEIEEEDRLWQQARGEHSKPNDPTEEEPVLQDATKGEKAHELASKDEPKSKAPAGFF